MKNLKLIERKLDNEKFAAIRIHRQYNITSHRHDKAKVLNKSIKNKKKTTKTKKKLKVIVIDSEDSSRNNHKESLNLKYQEQLLVAYFREYTVALRECEAKVHLVELANLEKEQALKPTS
ncbi:hypothetical protein C2G38_2215009 [Gigaspora rosea]|uniref:Uncharacterized protein n=1 Tax=Gigaspora rosea TaxID=44941 RepID=A0A397UAR1_9GLOM|nr:hypothetical protein C2G38_2215009 [Gigaspora rosea]